MTEQEKSLELARLMGFSVISVKGQEGLFWHDTFRDAPMPYEPYDLCPNGLAQFAAILLKFQEVVREFPQWTEDFECTQANILDEILRVNGVEA